MTRGASSVSVFKYLNYRAFLKDWFRQAKKTQDMSLRLFSTRAGFSSPNYLKMVIDGDRNLSRESIAKFIVGLNLNKQEQDFFKNIVHFTQAKTIEEKDQHYYHVLQSRKFNELTPIAREQYRFYSTWYHPVVRELVSSKKSLTPPEEIARRVFPPITPKEAKKSIELLQKLGFITKDQNNCWQQTSHLVTSGAESDSLVLTKYHQEILDLAKKILAETPQANRDISALTLGIQKEKLPLIKEKIRRFRKEILQLVSDEVSPEQVVLLTIQLLPVTQEETSLTAA